MKILKDLWDNIKYSNIHIQQYEKEKRDRWGQNTYLKKQWLKIFPILTKETYIQVREAQNASNKINSNRSAMGHIIIKILKVKEKENLKNSQRKTDT